MKATSLAAKTNFVTLAALILGLAVIGFIAQETVTRNVQREMRTETDALMNAVDASIVYTETQVTPLLNEASTTQFLPQAVPFYAAAKSFDLITTKDATAHFRLPTLNPTNEADRPHEWESRIIQTFMTRPDMTRLSTEEDTDQGRTFMLAKPIVANAGCLACHGSPDQAPRSMIDVYGSQNGFGWKNGQLVGAQIVSMSEAAALIHARKIAWTSALCASLALFTTLLALNVFVQLTIVRPLRRLAERADDISLGDMEADVFPGVAHGEVGLLAKAFDRMRHSLGTAMKLLET